MANFFAEYPIIGTGGTVTSVGLSAPASILSVSGSPVTSSGTLALSLVTQAANTVWSGPTTGSPANPIFRALVTADIPSLTATYLPVNNPTYTGLLSSAAGTMTVGGYHLDPSELNAGNSGTAITLDLSAASAQLITLTGNATITLTNPVLGAAYLIRIYTGAGGFTYTFSPGPLYPGGVAPVATATAAKQDLINFYWNGFNYLGTFAQNF